MTYDEIIQFHGHECPGLAMGYRMASAAMENFESFRAEDEELVAISRPIPYTMSWMCF
jgi:formylmethanofuran dehydrogenase subunit E